MSTVRYRFEVAKLVAGLDRQVKRRARAAGIVGHRGGWLTRCALGHLQGWTALRYAAAKRIVFAERAGALPPNLVEILDGQRVGTPTLSAANPVELAVGLLSSAPVSWRDLPRDPELRDDVEVEDLEGPEFFAVLWPNPGRVSREQVKRWACDDLANEEKRRPRRGWASLAGLQAAAIVHHYGNVTLAMTEGVTLPEYTRGAALEGVDFEPAFSDDEQPAA